MAAWLINYHKWPSSLSLTLMPSSAPADIFLGRLYFEELWNAWHTPPWFPWFPLVLRAPIITWGVTSHPLLRSSSPAGHPLCPPGLALVQLVTPTRVCACVYVCVYLSSSHVLFILLLAFPAQPFSWSQTTYECSACRNFVPAASSCG